MEEFRVSRLAYHATSLSAGACLRQRRPTMTAPRPEPAPISESFSEVERGFPSSALTPTADHRVEFLNRNSVKLLRAGSATK